MFSVSAGKVGHIPFAFPAFPKIRCSTMFEKEKDKYENKVDYWKRKYNAEVAEQAKNNPGGAFESGCSLSAHSRCTISG